VADDIAYALHGLDVPKHSGGRAEEDLRKHRDQLEQRVPRSNRPARRIQPGAGGLFLTPSPTICAHRFGPSMGFTRILADDYASHLDTEGKRLCSIIHENTAKMGRLIDDLLAFSRLGRAEMSLSPVDMQTMANSVFHELTTPESLARIDFQVGACQAAVADPTLMRQVWMNLLSNANQVLIQTGTGRHQGERTAESRRERLRRAGQRRGIRNAIRRQALRRVQRLHSSKEFEGTGVGLALVQRVIRRHGGRVWAEGEIDKGATFYFALQQRGA